MYYGHVLWFIIIIFNNNDNNKIGNNYGNKFIICNLISVRNHLPGEVTEHMVVIQRAQKKLEITDRLILSVHQNILQNKKKERGTQKFSMPHGSHKARVLFLSALST